MTLPTTENFQRLLAEIAAMGDRAQASATTDPAYQRFIARFPASALREMSLDDYCVGKGGGDSFCWWIERGLEEVLGRYMPGSSKGHLLYFTKDGSVYKHRFIRSMSDEAALAYTLKVQAAIAEADVTQDLRWLDDDDELFRRSGVEPKLSVGVGRKLRLLSVYHPDSVLPIHSSEHVGHFLTVLGCPPERIPPFGKAVARMLLLTEYYSLAKQAYPALTPLGFMWALYSETLGLAPVRQRVGPDGEEGSVDVDTADDFSVAGAKPPLNQILYGPPGTGKTFATVDAALEILDAGFLRDNQSDRPALKARFDELHAQGRVQLVTFHQSFSYEDFVEGLRADADDDGQVRYEVADGVFKQLCQTAVARVKKSAPSSIDVADRRIWKMSLGNTLGEDAGVYDECVAGGYALLGYGKRIDFSGCSNKADIQRRFEERGVKFENAANEYAVTSVNAFVTRMKPGDLLVVTEGNTKFRAIGEVTGPYEFAPHPDYEEGFCQRRAVKWLRTYEPSLPHGQLMNNKFSQMTLYELKSGSIDLAKLQGLLADRSGDSDAAPSSTDARVLIIDEINRGNVSRIFGELITLIEPTKRSGAPEQLTVTLPYSKEPFSIPANVYLVGTMNTADRSLAGLDIALRRRFDFRELPPKPELLAGVTVEGVNIAKLLAVMNDRIEALLGRDHCLGHAYFLPLKETPTLETLAAIFRQKIVPLLQEYFFEDWQRIQWVLNDHRKSNADYQFVRAVALEPSALFGSEVNTGHAGTSWRINGKAFGSVESYLGILDSSAAA